jgi:NAD(P)H dehydrogenase (quinone)
MHRKFRVLVMGSAGQVGGSVVNQLKNNLSIEVVAAPRNVAKAQRPGVPVVHLDLDRVETMPSALEYVDRAFMATGYTVDMLRQNKDLVNHAKRAGVKLIVNLGACGNDDTRVAHYGWHQFIERSLSGRTYRSCICELRYLCRICSAMAGRAVSMGASYDTMWAPRA